MIFVSIFMQRIDVSYDNLVIILSRVRELESSWWNPFRKATISRLLGEAERELQKLSDQQSILASAGFENKRMNEMITAIRIEYSQCIERNTPSLSVDLR
jgi:hypothetical protein